MDIERFVSIIFAALFNYLYIKFTQSFIFSIKYILVTHFLDPIIFPLSFSVSSKNALVYY